MKKIIITILCGTLTAVGFAGLPDSETVSIKSTTVDNGGTNSATTAQMSGRVIAVDFTMSSATTTQTVTLAAGNQTIFTAALSASGTYYPRTVVHGTNALVLNYVTNSFESVYLVRDKVTVTSVTTHIPTNTFTTRIMLSN